MFHPHTTQVADLQAHNSVKHNGYYLKNAWTDFQSFFFLFESCEQTAQIHLNAIQDCIGFFRAHSSLFFTHAWGVQGLIMAKLMKIRLLKCLVANS